ncbi:unnamed protein product [Phytophthora lilii]|uniref:Unnamed protein product n=1 Tax=Phytophthora lilii TaxID=2077276 RepID=A0A9W7D8I1_9STRA|nr:unnamed protein product [Phytophthora lilii]
MMRRMQEEEAEEAEARAAAQAPEMHALMHTSPIVKSAQTPQDLIMDMNDSPRSSSAPLPAPAMQEGSAFSFLAQPTHQHQQEYAPAPMAAEPMTPPVSNSAFGFLSANGGEVDSPPPSAAPPASGGSAFSFMAGSPPQNTNPPSAVAVPSMPAPSAPPLSSESSSFSFLNQTPAANSVHAIEHGIPSSSTAEAPSAFAFLGGHQQQQPSEQKSASAVAPSPTPAAPTPVLQRRHTVFDTLPEPTLLQPTQMIQPEKEEEKEEEPELSDPIHDAFEGLDANDGAQALDSFDAYKPSSDAVHGGTDGDIPEPTQSNEPLREVILEIEVPPGPMGVMLDRTIPDMTVIERFVPLPTGGRGYLELHPAICPGCALISINSIYVENKGLAEVGPILGSLANAPKLLRFKKLMNNGRTANPSTLQMPYVPPPLEEEDESTKDDRSVEDEDAQPQPESEDIHTPGSSSGEAFMTRLNGYRSGLSEIEAKLKEIIRREHGGQPVVDRRNQLAQLHGTVEKIQTQGIDSVIFGEHRPPNYEEVKQFRSTLVRKADELARLIQSTASTDPPPPYSSVAASDEEKHPVSAFAFVGGDSNSTVNDPPLGISQLQGDSGFQFLNANANPQVADVHGVNVVMPPPSAPVQGDNSYGFSFLRDNAQPQPAAAAAAAPLTVSQAPTSPSSSYGVLSTDGANPVVDAATNVFAGLNLKDDTQHQQQPARPAPALYDTLTKSSHGRPMGLSDLELSLRSTASSRPPMSAAAPGPPAIAESTQLSFGFMSSLNARDQPVFDSSSTSTEPTSPTAFGFMRGSNTSSTTPTVASSTVSQAPSQRSVLQDPEPSMFSFISN